VDFSADAIVIHQERIILYANRAASNLLGLSDPDELIGVDISKATR
jgi:PAS domain-containing protein